MILYEYLNNITNIKKQNGFNFDSLLKTDSDSYVNLPKLCNFMIQLIKINNCNPINDGIYMILNK